MRGMANREAIQELETPGRSGRGGGLSVHPSTSRRPRAQSGLLRRGLWSPARGHNTRTRLALGKRRGQRLHKKATSCLQTHLSYKAVLGKFLTKQIRVAYN